MAVHIPVCVSEVLDLLAPTPGATILDATVGEGGHAEALAAAVGPTGRVIGCDRDPEILAVAAARLAPLGDRVRLARADASDAAALRAACAGPVDGALIDLGISSWHYAAPERGFAFEQDGPLDMRLERDRDALTAADWLRRLTERELRDALYRLADERLAPRIARALSGARERGTLPTTTAALASLVSHATGGRRGHLHPATRTFLTLRILVNGELDRVVPACESAFACLRPGGRLVVIAFHSGEDRLVKRLFRSWKTDGRARLLVKKPLRASPEEAADNPRSRSACVRGVEKSARTADQLGA